LISAAANRGFLRTFKILRRELSHPRNIAYPKKDRT
jgi:hypothetical protein